MTDAARIDQRVRRHLSAADRAEAEDRPYDALEHLIAALGLLLEAGRRPEADEISKRIARPRRWPDEARLPLRPEEMNRHVRRTIQRGVFFALDAAEVRALRRAKGDVARRAWVASLEEGRAAGLSCDADKSWAYLRLLFLRREPEVNLFGKAMHRGYHHLLGLLEGDELRTLAATLSTLDEAALRARYETFTSQDFHQSLGVAGAPPFAYLAEWYARIRAFVLRAAADGRAVLLDAAMD